MSGHYDQENAPVVRVNNTLSLRDLIGYGTMLVVAGIMWGTLSYRVSTIETGMLNLNKKVSELENKVDKLNDVTKDKYFDISRQIDRLELLFQHHKEQPTH